MERITPYMGELTPEGAASAIQAARWNALDLLDTADLLYGLKRFAHSVVFSTIAIEEAGKLPLLLANVFLGFGGDRSVYWRHYRTHKAKTAGMNAMIEARVRVTFPEVPKTEVEKIGKIGPTSEQLETEKQRALYSDCVSDEGNFICHSPRKTEWRHIAWDRLCEAQVIVSPLRDYPPEELEIWLKHARHARSEGKNYREVIKPLHDELLEKKLIKEDQWKPLLAYLDSFVAEELQQNKNTFNE